MLKMTGFFKFQLPALIWAVLIFTLSSIPNLSPPDIGLKSSDLVAHFIEYSIFGYLLTRALYLQSNNSVRKYAILLGIILGFIYAVFDEFHQSFVPGRVASLSDLTADGLGVLMAQAFFLKQYRYKKWMRGQKK